MTSHSDALRRRWADPAYRARQIAALRRAVAIRQAQMATLDRAGAVGAADQGCEEEEKREDEMSDDYALLDKDGDAQPTCPECEAELEWIECEGCGGEGEFDAYEIDPLWHDEGDTTPCHQCAGVGGWYVCVNPQCTEVQP